MGRSGIQEPVISEVLDNVIARIKENHSHRFSHISPERHGTGNHTTFQGETFYLIRGYEGMQNMHELSFRDAICEAAFIHGMRESGGKYRNTLVLKYGVKREYLTGQIAFLANINDTLANGLVSSLSADPTYKPETKSFHVQIGVPAPASLGLETSIYDFLVKHMRVE